jgi:hypothetical protein
MRQFTLEKLQLKKAFFVNSLGAAIKGLLQLKEYKSDDEAFYFSRFRKSLRGKMYNDEWMRERFLRRD